MLKALNIKTSYLVARNYRIVSNYNQDWSHIFFKMSESIAESLEKRGKIVRTKEERKQELKKRRQERKAVKQVGFSNLMLNQTQYYFENGFRKVYPYYFGWNTTAKERWFELLKLVTCFGADVFEYLYRIRFY